MITALGRHGMSLGALLASHVSLLGKFQGNEGSCLKGVGEWGLKNDT